MCVYIYTHIHRHSQVQNSSLRLEHASISVDSTPPVAFPAPQSKGCLNRFSTDQGSFFGGHGFPKISAARSHCWHVLPASDFESWITAAGWEWQNQRRVYLFEAIQHQEIGLKIGYPNDHFSQIKHGHDSGQILANSLRHHRNDGQYKESSQNRLISALAR